MGCEAPRVSVIVPCYNVQAYIGECLSSLMGQTFADFEVVCVDDGCTDDTMRVAREVVQGDERFVFVSRANGGLSAARNTGIDASRGEYLLFLDSDDYYVPTALERLMARVSEAGVDEDGVPLEYVDFTAESFYESSALRKSNEEEYGTRSDIEGVMTGQALFARYQGMRQYICSACFHMLHRGLFERSGIRFREGIIHEDELFSPMIIAFARRAAFLNEPLYMRRMREGSIMTVERGLRNVSSFFALTQELHAWAHEHASEFEPAYADALAQRIYELRSIMAADVRSIPEGDIAAFAQGLPAADRMDFQMYAVQPAAWDAEVRNSHSYRLGHALLAPVRLLKRK